MAELRRNAPGGRINRVLLSGVLAAIVALGLASSASAASFEVNSDADTTIGGCQPLPGDCTLREALMASQSNPGFDEITFDPTLSGDTIIVGSQLPNINGPMNVVGLDADQLAVSGNSSSRIIAVDTATPGDDVRISGLTFKEGASGNQGGALLHIDADLTIADSAITDNVAESGAGIYSFQGASLTIERSEITGNQAVSASTGAGGGGFTAANTGPVTVRNSTISNNSASSSAPGVGQVLGGGIQVEGTTPSLTIENSTVASNAASSVSTNVSGGGINAPFLASDPVLRNTIVADNAVGSVSGPTLGPDLVGIFNSAFTLVEDTTDATVNETIPGSNIPSGMDPELQPLALNGAGATTRTKALGATSPALDAGRSFCAATDQRGTDFGRPSDLAGTANSTAAGADGADIGAYEEQGGTVSIPPLCLPPPPTGQPQPPNDITFGKLKLNKKKGIAFLFVDLPGPGEIGLAGKGVKPIGLAGASARKSRAVAGGRVKLKIAPAKKGKRGKRLRARLRDKGKAKLKVRVTFMPTGGVANTRSKKVKLVRK